MKFKEGSEIATADFWYDLTDGGYIKPAELLEDVSDAKKVTEAIAVLQQFERSAVDQDVWIEM